MGLIVKNGIFYGGFGSGSGDSGSINSLTWAAIKNKPNTISGYGIIDAYTKNEVNNLIEQKVIDYIKTLDLSEYSVMRSSQEVSW